MAPTAGHILFLGVHENLLNLLVLVDLLTLQTTKMSNALESDTFVLPCSNQNMKYIKNNITRCNAI